MRRDMLVEEIMKRDIVTSDTDRPVTYILRLMKRADADGFLVVEDGKLIGLATYWDLMIRLGNLRVRDADASSIYASSVMEPIRTTLTPKSKVIEAAQKIAEDPAHIIPVLENGELVGVVEPRDLAKVLLDEEVPASNVSLRNMPTVNMSDRVIHARKLMMDSGLRSLATLNEGAVVGVINDDQVADAYVNLVLSMPMERQKTQIKYLLVADIGPRHVRADYDSSLADVAKLIVENPVKGVPLVDPSRALVGFVSVSELAKFIGVQA